MPFVLRKLGCCVPSRLDKAPRLVFILIQYLSNSTKQQILGRQCYLLKINSHREESTLRGQTKNDAFVFKMCF